MSRPPPSNDLSPTRSSDPPETLPPVEPPSVGFLVQLFVIPGVIVAVIFTVVFVGKWLLRGSHDPAYYIKKIRVPSESRFLFALQLADVLRDPRFSKFKGNTKAAHEIASILRGDLETGNLDEKSVTLRMYLCRLLGEFQVEAGIDELLEAATTHRAKGDLYVRRWAIQAIAIRSEHFASQTPPKRMVHPQLHPTMLLLANDEEPLVRSETAVALGWMDDELSVEKLESMLEDSYADARYNAALALARQGNLKAVNVLEEMLDPLGRASVELEKLETARDTKRRKIFENALYATRLLVQKNPGIKVDRLLVAVENLSQTELERSTAYQVNDTLQYLKSRSSQRKN